jgi:ABC-type sugar transport system ATPase subunit
MTTVTDTREAIRAEGIAKSFGPVVTLADVTMTLRQGEVLGLIGDKGAGKSTLIKILTGFHQPDAGRVFIDGAEVTLRSASVQELTEIVSAEYRRKKF